jgi:hypothetical protein
MGRRPASGIQGFLRRVRWGNVGCLAALLAAGVLVATGGRGFGAVPAREVPPGAPPRPTLGQPAPEATRAGPPRVAKPVRRRAGRRGRRRGASAPIRREPREERPAPKLREQGAVEPAEQTAVEPGVGRSGGALAEPGDGPERERGEGRRAERRDGRAPSGEFTPDPAG